MVQSVRWGGEEGGGEEVGRGGGGTGVISHILEWHIQFIISSERTMLYKLGGHLETKCFV